MSEQESKMMNDEIKSKLDDLIARLEYFDRDYQNVPLPLAKEIRDLVIGEQTEEDMEPLLNALSQQEFEVGSPEVFLQCESAVFSRDGTNSHCYTTSVERAKLLVAALNDWARLRKMETKGIFAYHQ